MLTDRTKLFPTDVVALFMDKMNDPHPSMRNTAQARTMLVRPQLNLTQYFRLLSNIGWARTVDDLHLRDTHFPNEVIVRPSERPHFTDLYINNINKPPNEKYVLQDRVNLVPSSTIT